MPSYREGPGFTKHATDDVVQLSYMQQRYYDPASMRFLSPDPIAAGADSFNVYAYANNNPYTFVDPDGRCAVKESRRTCISAKVESTGTDSAVASKAHVSAAIQSKGDYVVSDPQAKSEPLGTINRKSDKSLKAERIVNAETTYDNGNASAGANRPSGAEAIIHGHLPGQGLTDNAGTLGDSKDVIGFRLPVITVSSDGRMAVHEISDGVLQVRAVDGSEFNKSEQRHFQRAMNRRQEYLNSQ